MKGSDAQMRQVNPDKLNHLGKLREDANVTRSKVVEAAKCTKQYLSHIEKKGVDVSGLGIEIAKEMCALYKCTLEDIFPSKKQKAV